MQEPREICHSSFYESLNTTCKALARHLPKCGMIAFMLKLILSLYMAGTKDIGSLPLAIAYT